ncbi:MAG: hypothetical protein D6815_05140, partial [Candidatus Dadabacteria bacterium]
DDGDSDGSSKAKKDDGDSDGSSKTKKDDGDSDGSSKAKDDGDSDGKSKDDGDSDGKSGEKKTCHAQVKGKGVTFFLTQSFGCGYGPVEIDETARVHLSAPTSGPYAGILFYQDRTVDGGAKSIIANSSANDLRGVAYFPNTTVELRGGSGQSRAKMKVVAEKVLLSGHLKLGCPGSDSPLNPGALRKIVLVE